MLDLFVRGFQSDQSLRHRRLRPHHRRRHRRRARHTGQNVGPIEVRGSEGQQGRGGRPDSARADCGGLTAFGELTPFGVEPRTGLPCLVGSAVAEPSDSAANSKCYKRSRAVVFDETGVEASSYRPFGARFRSELPDVPPNKSSRKYGVGTSWQTTIATAGPTTPNARTGTAPNVNKPDKAICACCSRSADALVSPALCSCCRTVKQSHSRRALRPGGETAAVKCDGLQASRIQL